MITGIWTCPNCNFSQHREGTPIDNEPARPIVWFGVLRYVEEYCGACGDRVYLAKWGKDEQQRIMVLDRRPEETHCDNNFVYINDVAVGSAAHFKRLVGQDISKLRSEVPSSPRASREDIQEYRKSLKMPDELERMLGENDDHLWEDIDGLPAYKIAGPIPPDKGWRCPKCGLPNRMVPYIGTIKCRCRRCNKNYSVEFKEVTFPGGSETKIVTAYVLGEVPPTKEELLKIELERQKRIKEEAERNAKLKANVRSAKLMKDIQKAAKRKVKI